MKKILKIQLDTKTFQFVDIAERYRGLGGRGLTSAIIAGEVAADCDALGPKNKLVFAAGILAGTSVPNSGRLSIGGKSPLTGTIKESNAGGTAAVKLARLGLQAVVVEGCSDELVTIHLSKDGVRFESVAELDNQGNNATIAYGRQKYGEKIGVISIGSAGQQMLTAAGISVSSPDFMPRMAARGGLGAVMGAKRLKALFIDDTGGRAVLPRDQALYQARLKVFVSGISAHPLVGGLKALGTPLLVNMVNELGALTTKNYSQGQFDGAEKISGEKMAEIMASRPNAQATHRCTSGCIIGCSQVYTDEAGIPIVSGLEYETLALLGANCLIDDLDTIARMNAVCNDIGVDTMEVGGALAVAMEGGMLEWGNGEAALSLVKDIARGTRNGKMIGNGCHYTGEQLGVSRIPTVKRQCLSGYDPRVLKGTGVTYATSTMGADHTCGNALPSPANPDYDPSASTGQAPVSQFLQRYFAAVDSLGMCLFSMLPPLDMPELQDALAGCVAAILDVPLEEGYLVKLGQQVNETERCFNEKAGFDRTADRLPLFFSQEKLAPTGHLFDVSPEEMDTVHGAAGTA
ncbi:MAG: aldehyde ferredoxin oxidoreductase C-terminal domain-containing protein [Desulfopila sp.]